MNCTYLHVIAHMHIELMNCKMVLKHVVACWFNVSKLSLIQLLGHYSGNEATNMIGSLTARDWKDWRIPGSCSTLFRIKEHKQVAILLTVISRGTYCTLSWVVLWHKQSHMKSYPNSWQTPFASIFIPSHWSLLNSSTSTNDNEMNDETF